MSSDQRFCDATFLEPRQILLAKHQASFDIGSPILMGFEPSVMSPVSSLAHDFHSASMLDTPRKRLSLSSNCSSTYNSPNAEPSSDDLCESAAKRIALPFSDKENLKASATSTANAGLTFSPAKNVVLLGSPTRRGTPTTSSPSRRGLSLLSPSKSNIMLNCSPVRGSPVKSLFSPPKSPSSQDSGYLGEDCEGLEFKQPALSKKSPKTLREKRGQLTFLSRKFSSVSSEDEDGFSVILESDEETVADPSDKFNSLMSAPINVSQADVVEPVHDAASVLPPIGADKFTIKTSSRTIGFPSRQSIRRCLSMVETHSPMLNSPLSSRTLEAIDESPQASACFKRPDPPCNQPSPVHSKRRKSDTQENEEPERAQSVAPPCEPHVKKLFRSHSEANFSHHTIMRAVQDFSDNSDLIGDCTRPYILPLVAGKHPELKSVTCHTLADLVKGRYADSVNSYAVVDCRFPYEFEGGHVVDAKNLWSKDMVYAEFLESKGVARVTPQASPELASEKRDIIIFHCEFSSERGPNLSRFLRNKDRDANKEHYPALHWPEIYLLEGGYKEFYTHYPEMCVPNTYLPMLTEGYEVELKTCRARAKTFSNDTGRQSRTGQVRLKRLGL